MHASTVRPSRDSEHTHTYRHQALDVRGQPGLAETDHKRSHQSGLAETGSKQATSKASSKPSSSLTRLLNLACPLLQFLEGMRRCFEFALSALLLKPELPMHRLTTHLRTSRGQ